MAALRDSSLTGARDSTVGPLGVVSIAERSAIAGALTRPKCPTSGSPLQLGINGGRATKIALGVIAFNVAVQAATYLMERSGQMQPDTAISVALWVGLGFYAVVFLVVFFEASESLRPVWSVGSRRRSILYGATVGRSPR